jgi:hypothetical protein
MKHRFNAITEHGTASFRISENEKKRFAAVLMQMKGEIIVTIECAEPDLTERQKHYFRLAILPYFVDAMKSTGYLLTDEQAESALLELCGINEHTIEQLQPDKEQMSFIIDKSKSILAEQFNIFI